MFLAVLYADVNFRALCNHRMILMNYLNEMGDTDSSGLVGVMAVSTPWNCMESCESLEQPINSFLFNKHLTRNLVNMLHRYGVNIKLL